MATGAKLGLALTAALATAGCGAAQPYSLDMPPLILTEATRADVVDDRGRFREIFCAVQAVRGDAGDRPCGETLHRLGREPPPSGRPVDLGQARVKLRILVVPGIFGECAEGMARPFDDAIEPLAALGHKVASLRVSGRSSSAHNAEQIKDHLARLELEPGEKLVLIGYSKGMSDLIELIGSEAGRKEGDRAIPAGSTIVSLTGVVAGTPIADGGEAAYRAFWWVPLPGCRPGDGKGVASLTRRHRLNYLAAHPLPSDLHYVSVPAFTRRGNVSSFLKPAHASLSKIDPRNDGNVIFHDSIIPGSRLLAYVDSDHWALALPFAAQAKFRSRFFATRNNFPRAVLLESIARSIEEHYLALDQAPAAR